MRLVEVLLFFILNFVVEIKSRSTYLPVLMWSSPQFQDGPVLALNKIKSESFETFIKQKLSNRKPLFVVFLEQILSTEDFDWRDENGCNSYPFLSNIQERVDYFPYVESPHQAILKLLEEGYQWRHMQKDIKIRQNESVLLLVEFRNIITDRPSGLKKHDEVIESVFKKIEKLREDWICIYTARHTKQPDIPVKLSPWHVPPEDQKPLRILNSYKDDYTGVALMTTGAIELHLPSHRDHTIKFLEDYLGVSAVQNEDMLDFVIWFENYTITFFMSKSRKSKSKRKTWMIDTVKVQNHEGDAIKLFPKHPETKFSNKCYRRATEFHSNGKPLIKVKISKYLLHQVDKEEAVCDAYNKVSFYFCIMISGVLSVILIWNKFLMVPSKDVEKKPKIFAYPIDEFFTNLVTYE